MAYPQHLQCGEPPLGEAVNSAKNARQALKPKKKVITDYVEATLLAADHDCLYLYEQGAKDCVALLKKLGVL